MREGIVFGTVDRPATVLGVHGADGLSRWACLARGAGLTGSWEAVEWAGLPPGGISGAHLHSRTEELYLILSGTGEISLNEHRYEVGPGHLVVTGLGTRHGLRNIGTDDLNWLVVEVITPAAGNGAAGRGHLDGSIHAPVESSVLRPVDGPVLSPVNRPVLRPGGDMSGFAVVNLRETREVDASTVLTGPLRTVRLAPLAAAEQASVVAEDAEHTLFVVAGSAQARSGDTALELTAGSAVTLPLGTDVLLTAGTDGLELFQATLAVSGKALP